MRTNITISLDPEFVKRMDLRRGSMPRSRWLEAVADPDGSAPIVSNGPHMEPLTEQGAKKMFKSPTEEEPPPLDKWGEPAGTVYDETDYRSWT